MLISIGILAWNEERTIQRTLRSLFEQTVLQATGGDGRDFAWEIVVVPNGCTDATAAISRELLDELIAKTCRQGISCRVCELQESGKSNAWNKFVHEFSSQEADLIAMMDADIVFGEADTLAKAVSSLLADPHALASVDLPLKDALKKPKRSLVERLSVRSSRNLSRRRPELCGQFFVARAAALRRIWMPKGLSVEDGFLHAMLVTNCFLEPADHTRIIRAEGASHYYETLTSIGAIFRHELRLVIGTSLNCYLIWDFLLFATEPGGSGAGELIRRQLQRDPGWYEKLIGNTIRNHGWWALPRGLMFRRFSGRSMPRGFAWIKWFIGALALFVLFDVPILLMANHRIKKLDSIGYW